MQRKISIVIPTYNEALNIKILISEIFSELKKAKISGELIIVDDNSPDGTGKIADKLSKKYNIKVIHRAGKLGLGSAVSEGFKKAKNKIIGVMDADLSHPPKIIPKLAEPLIKDEADFVIGSRYERGGGIEKWPLHRKMVSNIAKLMSRPLTNAGDPMSGFFFLKKDILKGVNLQHKGYKICLEILVKAKYKKLKEVPYIFRNREIGQSKLGIGEYKNYIKNLFSLLLYKITKK
ncbi:MAG: polyprenol monophosphomannose synthase [archaeon]